MENVFVGLGSNVGDRLGFLKSAVQELGKLHATAIVRVSSIYETEPVGKKDQPHFLNMVIELVSALDASQFHSQCKEIERRIGRTRSERWGPREIDLDLLYFGRDRVSDGRLTVPHPEIADRRFVLVPMGELAPEWIDPVRRISIAQMLVACDDASAVTKTPYTTYTNSVEV
ncbi:MAG: 2-amino-4-hydroxy-6-hydroxymethyldihydropteridine diphosphokinase [Ignavibacteria bacterium]|nr:2-amino-4-hydroxy-6-hydroxymethyldihydropteridine diphosphokinase [Ignavibacteria bacterium]